MKLSRSGRIIVPAIAILALGLTACAPSGGESGGQARDLRVGMTASDKGTLDPHLATSGSDKQVALTIFEGLVRYTPGDSTQPFQPAIAAEIPETPEPNADGTQTWTFELRDDVMCHPGPKTEAYPLTADDVVFSIDNSRSSETSAYAADFANVQSVEKTGEHEIAITLTTPRSPALFLPLVANYAGGYVICQQAYEAQGAEDFGAHPVGTGPFMYDSYTPADSLHVVANPDYWRGEPQLPGVEFRYMPDDNSRESALTTGELDLMLGIFDAAWIDRMNQQEGITALTTGVGQIGLFLINTSLEPFDDIRVRQAIMYSFNRDAHVAVGGEGLYLPTWSITPSQNGPGWVDKDEYLDAGYDWAVEHDIDKAKKLLAEAGYPDGFSFSVVASEEDVHRDQYQVMQAGLATVGIDMQIEVVAHATWGQIIREGGQGIVDQIIARPTENTLVTQLFASQSIVQGGTAPSLNFAFYTGVDDLIAEAQESTDPEVQNEAWRQINLAAARDAVVIPSEHILTPWAYSDSFDPGFEPVNNIESSWVINELTALK